MKLIRATFYGGDGEEDWTNFWFTTVADAESFSDQFVGAAEVHIDQVEVPTSKDSLADAMNLADANPSVWPGTRKRTICLD